MDSLTNAGIQYAETTLTSGKKLIILSQNGDYQNAVDLCNQIGGEVLLAISDQENSEAGQFILANENLLGYRMGWQRAKNPSPGTATDGSQWIDPLTNQVVPYENLQQYYNKAAVYMRKFFHQIFYKLFTFYVKRIQVVTVTGKDPTNRILIHIQCANSSCLNK